MLKFNFDNRKCLFLRATSGAAGYDLSSKEDILLEPKESSLVGTGIKVAIPNGYLGILGGRSSLQRKHGCTLITGFIDSDYRGEILCNIVNSSGKRVFIPAWNRIAQLIVVKMYDGEAIHSEDLGETVRGEGGFGSTG